MPRSVSKKAAQRRREREVHGRAVKAARDAGVWPSADSVIEHLLLVIEGNAAMLKETHETNKMLISVNESLGDRLSAMEGRLLVLEKGSANVDELQVLRSKLNILSNTSRHLRERHDEVARQRDSARQAAYDATQGPWMWGDGSDADLDSMSDGMVVSMTAGVLRALLAKAKG